jgi:hypothetical protein
MMAEMLRLGIAVGIVLALAVGPVFLPIVQQLAARGSVCGGTAAWRTARQPLTYGTDTGEIVKAKGLVAR